MNTTKPKYWVFILEDNRPDTFILYAPLHKTILRLSSKVREQVECILNGAEVSDFGVVGELFTSRSLHQMPKGWYLDGMSQKSALNKITISLTNKCNLRCGYCYAETGCDFTTIQWEVAQASIDHLVTSVVNAGLLGFTITFHGGGEAFVEYSLMQKCVEYAEMLAEQNSLEVKFSVVTNTTLISEEIAVWLKLHNFSHTTVSMDGIQSVHDNQRPKADGSGSFKAVLRGANNLKKAGVEFSIRSTVTSIGVNYMADFIEFLASGLFAGGGYVHFEPVTLCGRAQGTYTGVDPEEYFENYLKAKAVGERFGIEVHCTMDGFRREKKKYCGASNGGMFCISPNGKVSGCSRVTKDLDSGSDVYFYGVYDPDTSLFKFDEEQRNKIRIAGALPNGCEECFARWTCHGTCPIARHTDPENYSAVCRLHRKLLMHSIQNSLS